MSKRRRKLPAKPKPASDKSIPLSELLPGTASPEERVKTILSQSAHFSGPIPHPEIFRLYGEIVPDAPERILRVFEADSESARVLPLMALEAQKSDNRRAHWMAWSLVCIAFGLSLVFALKDKDWLAGIVLGTTLAAILAGFLKSEEKT